MRLTCPNCAAVYEIGTGLIPAGGSHVQCSACQTRWFVRDAGPEPERLSEDQIIARLETRSQRPRLASIGAGPAASAPTQTAPAPELRPFASAPEHPRAPESVVAWPEAAATPLRPRPAPERPVPVAVGSVAPAQQRSRFGTGFALAVAVAGAGLGAYLRTEDFAVRVPTLGPALTSYSARVDAERDRIETQLGPWRDRAMDAVFPEG